MNNKIIKNLNFIKYYFLEDYLFGEVLKNFHRRGYLKAEEFFCIIIWKSNRNKTKIRNKLIKIGYKKNLKSLDNIIEELTHEIYKENDDKKKLDILLNDWKFGLSIATAILTVLYPTRFTIYDYRVLGEISLKDFSARKVRINKYFEQYIPTVNKQGVGNSLRNKDRYLWGRSFYRDLIKLLHKSI